MGTIAQGMITLTSVNDAFSVLLSPSSCVINADYNGKNPKLTYAYSDIKVVRGETEVPFSQPTLLGKTNAATVSFSQVDDTTWRVQITSVPTTDLSGSFQLGIKVGEDFQTTVTFSYTVVRETSMLDWILDWNGTYTQIAGKWIVTPKIFAGSKDAQNRITGVYIGPSFDNDGSTGLYGYKNDDIIFKLTETGGMIGGWQIENGGIQTSDGYLKILAEGSIISAPKGEIAWGLYKDGSATFAKGNVHFYADGSADFNGRITSTSGQIGGWYIGDSSLYNSHILLDANSYFIGIRRSQASPGVGAPSSATFLSDIQKYGGITMFYSNLVSYGLECYIPANTIDPTGSTSVKIFSLGSTNYIAGWTFDNTAIYLGTKNNTARQNTSNSGDITIGTNGLRGKNWYIDTDGEISFVGGLLHFDKDGGTIAGWSMTANTFVSTHAALTSYSTNAGLFLSAANFSGQSATNFTSLVQSNGGVYLTVNGSGQSELSAYHKGSALMFRLSSTEDCKIAGWTFDQTRIYIGQPGLLGQTNFTTFENSLVLGSAGIHAPGWYLLATGAGALACGHITWDDMGNVTFSSNVKLSWSSITGGPNLTKIDADGIYTGTISANNITAGTISTASIKCEGKWALNTDGSGYLAAKNITWTQDGELTVSGTINANAGSIAGFEISSGRIGVSATSSSTPGSDQAAWAALTISKDFFKVGGAKGYVLFGNDVIPATVGGAFTAVGRIVNNAPNTYGSYGYDQANYGLFIDVTGGTKNYGISSNAALKAPAFINTAVKTLTFSGSSYSIDFSQHTIFLLYFNENSAGVSVSLPSEASVARQFGLSSLPSDFGIVITFRVRAGSYKIILKDIYNANESLTDYTLNAGDSIQLLVTKVDGFRYQVLNFSS